MLRSDLLALAERVRNARAEHQHALLHEAILLVHRGNTELSNRAMRMLSVGAFLDAALTLVPEGWRWSVDFTQRAPYRDCGRVDLYAPGDGLTPPDVSDVYAATPALALCAAALRARAEDGNDG